jgi:hypothetical protein
MSQGSEPVLGRSIVEKSHLKGGKYGSKKSSEEKAQESTGQESIKEEGTSREEGYGVKGADDQIGYDGRGRREYWINQKTGLFGV